MFIASAMAVRQYVARIRAFSSLQSSGTVASLFSNANLALRSILFFHQQANCFGNVQCV